MTAVASARTRQALSPVPSGRCARGFTLLELCVVLGLIAVLMSVALPQLMPVIAYSELESAARHVATFGRAAISHCTLMQERFTIKIDLEAQEYWAVRWPDESEGTLAEDEAEREEAKEDRLFASLVEGEELSEEQMLEQAEDLRERFERFVRLTLEARARNVSHGGILDEIGPLFDDEFTIDDEEKADEDEVKLDFLLRTRMPENVSIESVQVGTRDYLSGLAEVEVTPLGLSEPVVFYVRGAKNDYFTVAWDPITGEAHLYEGKESLL